MISSAVGYITVIGFGLVMAAITWLLSSKHDRQALDSFLVADREVGSWQAGLSIAATWIWAPALFISAQQAFQKGILGFGWFFIPNVLCLIIFGYFSMRIREKFPKGYTFPQYILKRYSNRVHDLYLLQFIALQICSFAVQLLAGASIIVYLTGANFTLITLLLAGVALAYSLMTGLRASLITDVIQMIFILLIGFIFVPIIIGKAGGFSAVIGGLGGVTGAYMNLFSKESIMVLLTFGIVNTIGLLAGPFGDQTFWQRAFAIKKNKIKSAYWIGGLMFGIVPLLFSMLGFIGANPAISGQWGELNAQLINLEVVSRLLPAWTLIPFSVMLLAGLTSTLDSNLCAISSLTSIDLFDRVVKDETRGARMKVSRIAMVVLALLAVGVANLPGIKILHLFLFYGTLRASTLAPTVLTIVRDSGKKTKIKENNIFMGILLAICIGLPIFAVGKVLGIWPVALIGSLLTLGLSWTITARGLTFKR